MGRKSGDKNKLDVVFPAVDVTIEERLNALVLGCNKSCDIDDARRWAANNLALVDCPERIESPPGLAAIYMFRVALSNPSVFIDKVLMKTVREKDVIEEEDEWDGVSLINRLLKA